MRSERGSQRVPDSEAYWVVDPLDGTTNFAAGIPYWAISLARFEEGVPVLAVLEGGGRCVSISRAVDDKVKG